MVLEICRYNEYVNNAINNHDLQSNIDSLFYLLVMLIQKKRIDKLNVTGKKKDVTLLDFISEWGFQTFSAILVRVFVSINNNAELTLVN